MMSGHSDSGRAQSPLQRAKECLYSLCSWVSCVAGVMVGLSRRGIDTRQMSRRDCPCGDEVLTWLSWGEALVKRTGAVGLRDQTI